MFLLGNDAIGVHLAEVDVEGLKVRVTPCHRLVLALGENFVVGMLHDKTAVLGQRDIDELRLLWKSGSR